MRLTFLPGAFVDAPSSPSQRCRLLSTWLAAVVFNTGRANRFEIYDILTVALVIAAGFLPNILC